MVKPSLQAVRKCQPIQTRELAHSSAACEKLVWERITPLGAVGVLMLKLMLSLPKQEANTVATAAA
jgi:hypothetical protein